MTARPRSALAAGLSALALAAAALLPTTAAHAADPAAQTPSVVGAQQCGDPLMMSYYRTWRDIAADIDTPNLNQNVMSELPQGVDVAFVFNSEGAEKTDYFSVLRDTYVPALHAQGTKLVRTLGTHVLLDIPVPATAAGYDQIAQDLIADYVTVDGLDGLDIDMEQDLSPAQVDHFASIVQALGSYLGPQGEDGTLLIYDTNRDGDEPVFAKVAPYISYVLVQSYGRSVGGLQTTWDSYAPHISSCQYLIGFSFYEERGAYWGDTLEPFDTSRAASYAKWEPTGGQKGGIFSYAVDRDWKAQGDDTLTATDYPWTRALIELQDSLRPSAPEPETCTHPGKGKGFENGKGHEKGKGRGHAHHCD